MLNIIVSMISLLPFFTAYIVEYCSNDFQTLYYNTSCEIRPYLK